MLSYFRHYILNVNVLVKHILCNHSLGSIATLGDIQILQHDIGNEFSLVHALAVCKVLNHEVSHEFALGFCRCVSLTSSDELLNTSQELGLFDRLGIFEIQMGNVVCAGCSFAPKLTQQPKNAKDEEKITAHI